MHNTCCRRSSQLFVSRIVAKSGALESSEYKNRAQAFRNASCMRTCVLLRCKPSSDSSVLRISDSRSDPSDVDVSKPTPFKWLRTRRRGRARSSFAFA